MWSKEQTAALRAIEKYRANPESPVFLCGGFAGTGKTTLIPTIWNGADSVAVVAPTGKAAQVLRRKGVPATTVHSLIYRPIDSISGQCAFCNRPFNDGDSAWTGEDDSERTVRYACARCKFKLVNARSWRSDGPRFTLRESLGDIDLIICDEISMVGKKLARDLLSFRIPVLGFGDPFQLGPVQDEAGFDLQSPDAMLTQIHRAAWDNPITLMATVVREGGQLEFGEYGSSRVVTETHVRELLEADQVVVGLNRTRIHWNSRIRKLRGFSSPLPQAGDKVICLRNEHDRGLLNGQLWGVLTASVVDEAGASSQTVEMLLRSLDDLDAPRMTVRTPSDFFLAPETDLPWFRRRAYSEFTFGWALTTHKCQGSEFDSVVLIDESGAFRDMAARHLYTGLTRARSRITVVTS